MKRFITITFICLIASACEKYQSPRVPGMDLEFYLIRDFQKVTGTAKIINSTAKLTDSVLIYYDEIVSYNPDDHSFSISEECAERIGDFKNTKIHGTPFAVTVDKQIIYTGYFWCSFSSSMVDWITIDPLCYFGKNTLYVSLGYPGMITGDYIPDNRNDSRILNVLRKDSKLR